MTTGAKSGKLVLLYIVDEDGSTLTPIATARTNSFTVNSTIVDTSTKKDDGWGSILSGGGVREMSITLEGIYEDEAYDKMMLARGMDGASYPYAMIDAFENKWEGNFVITSYGAGGTYNDAQTFTVSMRNDGAIDFTPAA